LKKQREISNALRVAHHYAEVDMPDDKQRIDDLSQTELARFILDIVHRSLLHYGLWFTEVRHQMGTARALGILKTAYERSMDIQMNRLSKVFGFELQDGLPKALLAMDRGELKKLLDGFCACPVDLGAAK